MHSRRTVLPVPLVLALALSLLSVGGLVGSSPATAAVAAVAPRSDHVEPADGRQRWRTVERMVPTVTGPDRDIEVVLDTRLYVPRTASRRDPRPAVLMTNGFGLDKDANEIVTTARFLAAHGYVVLTYSASGFGDSGGCVTLQSADYDVPSASQLISTVLGPRPDVLHDRQGVVLGTIGGSYGGGGQLPLAAADPRVRTALLGRTWNDLFYSLDPNNRVVPGDPTGLTHGLNDQGVFKQGWTSLFFALGNSQPAQGNGGCPEAKIAAGDPTELAGAAGCPGYYLALCDLYARLDSTGDADPAGRDLVARASASTFIDDVDVPVLLVQGQSDTLFNLNDATATYRALRRRGVPTSMIWNSGGHGGYLSQPGECEAYDGQARTVRQMDHCYLTLRSLRWLDHWLRGRPGGAGPGFSYYRDWVSYGGRGAADEQYGAARTLPRATTRFALSGTDRLVARSARARAGSADFLNPAGGMPAAYSETSNFSGPDSEPSSADVPPQEVEGQFAAFTTGRLRRPLVSVGIPAARLRMSHTNGSDLVFFAKVYDVAADGSQSLVHRLISPVRVPAGAVDQPVRLRLAGFAHRFDRGHRVRLVLCSTDQTSHNATLADTITVTTGAGASVLTLPGRLRR